MITMSAHKTWKQIVLETFDYQPIHTNLFLKQIENIKLDIVYHISKDRKITDDMIESLIMLNNIRDEVNSKQ